MSFLDDKTWDEMDWLNKAVEPYIFSFNQDLARLPSEYVFSYRDFESFIKKSRYQISLPIAVEMLCSKFDVDYSHIVEALDKDTLFRLDMDLGTTIDIQRGTIDGKLSLVKLTTSLSDEQIRDMLVRLVDHIFGYSSNGVQTRPLKEVMDIVGCQEAKKSNSTRKKWHALKMYMSNIFRENTWNIKNVDLAIKLIQWIENYCRTESRLSLANLSKLKCMVHNGHPIYSMEEIV